MEPKVSNKGFCGLDDAANSFKSGRPLSICCIDGRITNHRDNNVASRLGGEGSGTWWRPNCMAGVFYCHGRHTACLETFQEKIMNVQLHAFSQVKPGWLSWMFQNSGGIVYYFNNLFVNTLPTDDFPNTGLTCKVTPLLLDLKNKGQCRTGGKASSLLPIKVII